MRSEVYNRLAVNNTSSGGGRRPIAGEVGFLNGISTPEGELLEGPLLYEVTMRKGFHEFFPKVPTPVYGYHSSTLDGGVYPFDYLGPTMMTNAQVPIIVRYINDMGDVLTSIHQHGGHNSRVDDGHPADLIIPLGFDPHATPTTEFMEHLLEEERPSPFEAVGCMPILHRQGLCRSRGQGSSDILDMTLQSWIVLFGSLAVCHWISFLIPYCESPVCPSRQWK